eukprot:COSAG04_NODE_97_length_26459_cov_6.507246_7_plen_39_part_00
MLGSEPPQKEIAQGVRVQHFGGLRRTAGCHNQLFALAA